MRLATLTFNIITPPIRCTLKMPMRQPLTAPPHHIIIHLFVRRRIEILHRYARPADLSLPTPCTHGRRRLRSMLRRLRRPFSIGH